MRNLREKESDEKNKYSEIASDCKYSNVTCPSDNDGYDKQELNIKGNGVDVLALWNQVIELSNLRESRVGTRIQ